MADDQDWKDLSTIDKIEHKNWKARLVGYEEALKDMSISESPKDPLYNPYLGLVKNMVIDNNAVAQEKALEVILIFVQQANIATKAANDICPGIVNKCFNTNRHKTKELAFDILKFIIEIEKQDVVIEELFKGLSCKTPKVVVGAISVLKESLHEFGPKIMPIKELFKNVPKLLEDRDKNVREAGKELIIEMYRWLGSTTMNPVMTQLKPVQVTELTAEFDKQPKEKPVPTRYLRSQKPKNGAPIKSTASGDSVPQTSNSSASDETTIDPYDLINPVEVISKIPSDFFDKIEEKKWTDRKEALETIDRLTNHPKLLPGDYGDLIKALLKVVSKDTNIVLVALAAKILYQIATGLRKKYFPYALNTVQACLDKFKEKKANVVKALRDCIDSSFAATTFEPCLEEIVNALDHKTPSVRSETALFLNRVFEKCAMETLTMKLLKQLIPGLTKLCLDSTPEVRDAAFQTLGTAMKVASEKKVKPFLDKMDPVKMARINEFYEKAQAGPSQPNESVTTTVACKAVARPEPESKKPEVAADSSRKLLSSGKPATKKPVVKLQKAAVSKVPEIPTESVLSDEDVTLKANEIFGEALVNQITDKNWKERSTALEELQKYVKSKVPSEIPCQLLIRVMLLKPGLKDNNISVLKSKIELIKEIVMNGKLTWTVAEMCIGDLSEKIGDVKTSEIVKNTLTEMSDIINLPLIAGQVIKTISDNVNVKNLTETLNWLSDVIKEFGFKIPINDLLPFVRLAIQHTSPVIRQSGIKLIGTISLYVRDSISTLLKDEKSSVKQLIDAEIENLKSVDPPAPTKGLKNAPQVANSSNDADVVTAAAAEIDIDEMIPRENISSRFTENILAQLSDKTIKVKRDTLEEVTRIVGNFPCISGEGLQSLITIIAKNASDSSSVISKMAINILVLICNGLNKKDADRFIKTVIPALLASFNDPKPKNREDSITALNAWTEKVGFAAVVEGGMISDVLKGDKSFQKDAIFTWISPHLRKIAENKAAKKAIYPEFPAEMLPLLYISVEDRSKEVRESAKEAVLPFMLVYGYDVMVKHRKNNSKIGSKDNVLLLLEKLKAELPAPEPAAPKQPAKTASGLSSKPATAKESTGKKSEPNNKTKKEESKSADQSDKEVIVTSLISKTSNKKQRILEDKKKKITRWEPNVQQLNAQFTGNCSPELLGLLFSNDLKKFIKAIDLLNNFLSEDVKDSIEATKQNLDLILKWMVLRFSETNPSVLIKGLDYLYRVFSILSMENSFQLTDQETMTFVPDLILKMGDPKDQVRMTSQKILRCITGFVDSLKIVQILEENLSCKVARVRQESVDFLKFMIDEKKLDVANQKNLLKSIALLISERDNTVRTAALNCLVSAHNFMGEDLFNVLESLNDKDRSMLSERIKRTGKPIPAESDISSQSTVTSEKNFKSTRRESSANRESHKAPLAPTPTVTKAPICDINPLLTEEISCKLINVDKDIEELLQPLEKITLRYSGKSSQSVNSNDAITSVIHAINSADVQTSIQAMAQIDEVIRNQDVRSQLINYMDNLVMSITMQLKSTLGKLSEENFCESEITDMFKGMLATLVSVFNAKELACELNRDRLMNLMQSILRIVINDQLVSLAEGGTIIRGINILSVRILESSNQTRMLSALLRMMSDCLKNGDTSSKYLNLIFKCIWSMTKNLINTVNTIDLVIILKDIHTFYTDFPPHVWEAREGGRDVPLRTVKTLVYSIINNKNGGVLEALYQIPNAQHKDLDNYIRKSYTKLNIPIPTVLFTPPQNHVHINENTAEKSKLPPPSNSRPYLDELKEIFGKIGNPTKNKQGLQDLYDFKLKYPYVDLSRYLAQTTPYFQRTIETGLKSIAEERGQTPISVFGSNQLNNSGATASLEKDRMIYCTMDPEALLLRLKDLRVKAGLDKLQSGKPDSIVMSPIKDEMETSLITKLVPSGDGPVESRQTNPRKLSAIDLASIKQRFEALKRPN